MIMWMVQTRVFRLYFRPFMWMTLKEFSTLLDTNIFHALHELNFDSKPFLMQRVQKRLAVLNKRAKGGCSFMSLLLSTVGIVMLVVIVWLLMKYL